MNPSEALWETDRRGAGLFGAADLHGHNGFRQGLRSRLERLVTGDRVTPLDVQAEPRARLQGSRAPSPKADLRLIACRRDKGNRKPSLLHRQIQGDANRAVGVIRLFFAEAGSETNHTARATRPQLLLDREAPVDADERGVRPSRDGRASVRPTRRRVPRAGRRAWGRDRPAVADRFGRTRSPSRCVGRLVRGCRK